MRDVLLDTHVFLWSQFDPEKMPAGISLLLQLSDVRWWISQVSLLEIQVKFDIGKLPLPDVPGAIFPALIEKSNLAFQPLDNEAIFMLGKLPDHHRDPFDRLLISTALVHGWEIATVDPLFREYPVRIIAE